MTREKALMNAEEIREIMNRFGMDIDGMSDQEVCEMAEDLHNDLMDELTQEDEMSYHGSYGDDTDSNMADMERVESLESEMESMRAQMEEMRDMMMEEMDMMEDDMMDMESQMASLRDEKKSLEKRLEKIEDEPKEPDTHAETIN
jgi:hypothetical protein